MERMTKSYATFDCDAHINDPMGIWDHVPQSERELVRSAYWRSDSQGWLNELDSFCLEHIARFKRPKRYVFIEQLPRNATGKVLKRELRQQLTREQDQGVCLP